MNKIKKLGIAVIALAMCLLLGVTVWAADSEVKFEATASDTDFCITGEEQTVTVIISASEAIGLFSLDADLIVPAGWSATVSSVDLPEDGFFYNGKNVIWIDSEADGEISAEDLIKIEATIPANVEAGTYTIGVESLELTDVTINGKTYSEIYWTEDATLSVEITVKAHEYNPPEYNNDGETHTETFVCRNNASHVITKTGVPHDFTNGDCPCGAVTLTVVKKGSTINYTVSGRVVTVTCQYACKVGYLSGDKYVTTGITKTKISDTSYRFTIPAGVSEVLIVVKGDITGDGKFLANDKATINAALSGKISLSADKLFAGDISGDGKFLANDKAMINAILAGKINLSW